MKLYLDDDFKCYTENLEGYYHEIDTDFFDGKCQAFIEGYRFVPAGRSWTRSDGKTFQGEMIVPWKDYSKLDSAQREYEREQLEESITKIEEFETKQQELNESYTEGVNSI